MAASRKPPSVEPALLAPLGGKRLAVGLSGGVDSVVLLHLLHALAPRFGYKLSAVHVNHGLSPNADDWQRFCSALCSDLDVPLKILRISVSKKKQGLEAAAREARRAALQKASADAIALAHQLDDQAETVLFNLLRGTGLEGASGMPASGTLGRKLLLRPLLGVPRSAIRAYAAAHRLGWIEDESNRDESLTRNFIRRRVGPLLEARFPRWRESLARAARHFADRELDARKLLRNYLKEKGLRAPSEARLAEMLRQLSAGKGAIEHEGVVFRAYRGKIFPDKKKNRAEFKPKAWNGESRLELPELGGELRFRKVRGKGIDRRLFEKGSFEIRLRSGGERLQPDPRRPRRTLKNLFQEAGVPPWQRERLPLLYRGADLVWAPGLGVDVKFLPAARAEGLLPEWKLRA
ncbi:MAG: tRNA lysidine(34) synthetase TilS [Pseudomonadota bacterium]